MQCQFNQTGMELELSLAKNILDPNFIWTIHLEKIFLFPPDVYHLLPNNPKLPPIHKNVC